MMTLAFRRRFLQAVCSSSVEKKLPSARNWSSSSNASHWWFDSHPLRARSFRREYFRERRTLDRSSSQILDRRPAGVRLAASILGNSPVLLLAPASDLQLQKVLTDAVFQKLNLAQPAVLPDSYPDPDVYHESLSSCVVEEARYSIVNALQQKSFHSKSRTENEKTSIKVHVTGDRSEGSSFFECYTYEPLSHTNRNNLTAGSVIVMVPIGSDYDPGNMTFGTIRYGSVKSRSLPKGMQIEDIATDNEDRNKEAKDTGNKNSDVGSEEATNDNKDGDKRNEKKEKNKKEGDRLTFDVYGSHEVSEGVDLEMHFVTSILNFQRQFLACKLHNENSQFGGEILGNRPVEDDEGQYATSASVSNHAFDSNIHRVDGTEAGFDSNIHSADTTGAEQVSTKATGSIVIPALNEAQQKAVDDFLFCAERKIHIVQGPPGTGKTTMTVAAICRYLERSQELGLKRRLLVCGPTNKSVVVLARKLLHCIRNEDSVNAVLIGDKTELLADNRAELESSFVYTYGKHMVKKWRLCGNTFLKKYDYDTYEKTTFELLTQMKKVLRKTSFFEVEQELFDVGTAFEDLQKAGNDAKAREGAEKDLKNSVIEVTKRVKNLDQQQVVQDLLASADVIFCTLSSAGSMPIRRMDEVSGLIVDEASACTEAELLIPLHSTKPERLLLVGDPKQLPATVMSPLAIKCGFPQSLQDRLMYKNKFDYSLLNVQYRMRPEISMWPIAQFYDNKVQDGENVEVGVYQSEVSLLSGDPYSWIQVSAEEKKDKNSSTFNEGEAEAVISILLQMKEKHNLTNDWFSPDRIRVITFYQAQVNYLQLVLRKYQLNVMVSTVDASQGSEADMVILSFVRGTSGHMGFLKDNRRLNVALTRAKFQLVCVGNIDAIVGLEEKGGNTVLRGMAAEALSRCTVFPRPDPLPPPPPKFSPKARKQPKKKKGGTNKQPKKKETRNSKQPKKEAELWDDPPSIWLDR